MKDTDEFMSWDKLTITRVFVTKTEKEKLTFLTSIYREFEFEKNLHEIILALNSIFHLHLNHLICMTFEWLFFILLLVINESNVSILLKYYILNLFIYFSIDHWQIACLLLEFGCFWKWRKKLHFSYSSVFFVFWQTKQWFKRK